MIIDLHCDTVYKLYTDESTDSLDRNSCSVDAERMIKGGVSGQCFAIFTPINAEAPSDGLTDWQRMNGIHDRFTSELKRSTQLKQAFSAADIKDDAHLAILTVEELGPLEGKMERLEEIASWGVRISGLTWNWENAYGYPNSKNPKIMGRGLKEKGFEAIEFFRMHDIAVDVSHLSDGGFYDVLNSGCKVLATHSNSRAITDVTRNLTDEMLKALADKGGVAGLNFCPSFLTSFSDGEEHVSRVSDMVRHVMHIYNTAGEDVLALGTDFDGIGGVLEIPSPDYLYLLWDALRSAGLSERIIDKMKGTNALRLL